MGISAVSRKDTVGRANQAGAPVAAAASLSLGGDSLRLSRRDGASEKPAATETPGAKKMAWGGGVAAACIVGLGLTLSTVGMPVLVPLAFGAGALVGGGMLLSGAKEFAEHLTSNIKFPMPQ